MTALDQKKSNPLFEILFNVFLPSFILMKLSGDEYLGSVMALVVALSFPIAYGGLELVRNKKFNFIAALGFISVFLTGGIGKKWTLDEKFFHSTFFYFYVTIFWDSWSMADIILLLS